MRERSLVRLVACATAVTGLLAAGALAQQTAVTQPASPVPAAAPSPAAPPPIAAKSLFGAVTQPAKLAPRAIGEYAKGCLAGGEKLPVTGRAWQVMRLKRNRNWGHPALVDWLQRFAEDAQAYDGWPGLLVGDIAQPRGGPMLTGHASHQIGLDADIWLTPMPNRVLTPQEREDVSAVTMLGPDRLTVDPKLFDETRVRVLKRAASSTEVERIFVHPAIKKAMCDAAPSLGPERAWLGKIRPWWDHHYHFHVRLSCPKGSPTCSAQKPVPDGDGCGKEVDDWLKKLAAPPPPPPPPGTPVKPPPPPMTVEQLPAECKAVLADGNAR